MPPWLALLILLGFFVLFAAMARSRSRHTEREGTVSADEGSKGWNLGRLSPFSGGTTGAVCHRGDGDSGSDSGGGFSGAGAALAEAEPREIGNGKAIQGRAVFQRNRERGTPGGGS